MDDPADDPSRSPRPDHAAPHLEPVAGTRRARGGAARPARRPPRRRAGTIAGWRILRKSLDARDRDDDPLRLRRRGPPRRPGHRACPGRPPRRARRRPVHPRSLRLARARAASPCRAARSSSARGRPGCSPPTSWRSAAIGRSSWSGAGRSRSASPTSAASTTAGRSTRRATTSSARAAPAPSATASSPAEAPAPTSGGSSRSSPTATASPRSSTSIGRTSGSNRLPLIVRTLRRKIEELGGEVRFSCRVEDLAIADGRLAGLDDQLGIGPGRRRRAGHRPQRPGHLPDAPPPGRPAGVQALPVRRPDRAAPGAGRPRPATARSAGHPALGAADYELADPGRRSRPVHLLHVRRRLRDAAASASPATSAPTA